MGTYNENIREPQRAKGLRSKLSPKEISGESSNRNTKGDRYVTVRSKLSPKEISGESSNRNTKGDRYVTVIIDPVGVDTRSPDHAWYPTYLNIAECQLPLAVHDIFQKARLRRI